MISNHGASSKSGALQTRGRLQAWLRPKVVWTPPIILANGTIIAPSEPELGLLGGWLLAIRRWIADLVEPSKTRQTAQAIARTVLSSSDLVRYMAVARPYLCTRVMAQASRLVEEFQDEFFVGLLGNEASILYAELKNNVNLAGAGGRYRLPDENELLRFYLQDVQNAGNLGVFKSLGDAVINRIDSDDALLAKLNGPRLDYDDRGKRRCPVYVGIHFFDVMVQEGLHQRSDDHLWLHYFRHFTDHLLKRARALEPDDDNHEFATPLAYLLYSLVDAASHWVGEAVHLTSPGDAVSKEDVDGDRHVYISFEATEALGAMLESILASDKVTDRLKKELLDVVLHTLKELEKHGHLEPLAQALADNLARPYGIGQAEHLEVLRGFFRQVDGSLRAQARRLQAALDRK